MDKWLAIMCMGMAAAFAVMIVGMEWADAWEHVYHCPVAQK